MDMLEMVLFYFVGRTWCLRQDRRWNNRWWISLISLITEMACPWWEFFHGLHACPPKSILLREVWICLYWPIVFCTGQRLEKRHLVEPIAFNLKVGSFFWEQGTFRERTRWETVHLTSSWHPFLFRDADLADLWLSHRSATATAL